LYDDGTASESRRSLRSIMITTELR